MISHTLPLRERETVFRCLFYVLESVNNPEVPIKGQEAVINLISLIPEVIVLIHLITRKIGPNITIVQRFVHNQHESREKIIKKSPTGS